MRQWSMCSKALIAIALVMGLAGCVRQTNTAQNPEVGQATGAAAGDRALVQKGGATNPDLTTVPSPTGYQMVPEVPEKNEDLVEKPFKKGCYDLCVKNPETKHSEQYCRIYCDCTFEPMRTEVPLADLRAFARNEVNPSIEKINAIITKCKAVAQKQSTATTSNVSLPQAAGE